MIDTVRSPTCVLRPLGLCQIMMRSLEDGEREACRMLTGHMAFILSLGVTLTDDF